jgi:hypothetical protein
VGFKAVVIVVMLAAGAFGGAWAHFGASGEIATAEFVYSSARATFRKTARRFDNRYYERGETYAACIAGYGKNAFGKTNAELVWSCECADKSIGSLGSDHRESAMQVVSGKRDTLEGVTVIASRFLSKCQIQPAGKPGLQMTIRGSQ